MTRIAPASLPDRLIQVHGLTLSKNPESRLVVQGRDKARRPWQITFPPPLDGGWVVDNNSSRTYYFAGYTGGAGVAPDSWVIALSFDEKGRPTPFHMLSNHARDAQGICDLLQVDPGSPLLLHQYWLEKWEGFIRGGYFVTGAYRQQCPYWYKASGRFDQITFPAVEHLVELGAKPKLVPAPDVAYHWERDLGNDPRLGRQTKIVGIAKDHIKTDPDLGCDSISISVLVLDSRRGREIEVVELSSEELTRMLPNAARRPVAATLTGLHHWPASRDCSASIAWAEIR